MDDDIINDIVLIVLLVIMYAGIVAGLVYAMSKRKNKIPRDVLIKRRNTFFRLWLLHKLFCDRHSHSHDHYHNYYDHNQYY